MLFLLFFLVGTAGAITDAKTNCSFSFSSLIIDGSVSFDTVHRATFANCYFSWEDWFNASLGAFRPVDVNGMFQKCNGISASDFDNCVSGFILRYGALYTPDGTHVSYEPQEGECFGQLKFVSSVIWFITDHVANEICCSHRTNINPLVPKIERD
uniref:NS7a n=1 Tax=Alphacoronavirus UKMa1 TaxID=2520503 RepID=A0A481S169_9ALPC|nr:NS7a [Alphacoronavirus UKMa1]